MSSASAAGAAGTIASTWWRAGLVFATRSAVSSPSSAHGDGPAEAAGVASAPDDVVGARSDRPGVAKPAGPGVPGHLEGRRRPRADDGRPGGGVTAAGARPDRTGAVGNLHGPGQAGHITGSRPRAETTSAKDTFPPRVTRSALGETRTVMSRSWQVAGAARRAVESGPAGVVGWPRVLGLWGRGGLGARRRASRLGATGAHRRPLIPARSAIRTAGWGSPRHRPERRLGARRRGAQPPRRRQARPQKGSRRQTAGAANRPGPPGGPLGGTAPSNSWPCLPRVSSGCYGWRLSRAVHDTMRAWGGPLRVRAGSQRAAPARRQPAGPAAQHGPAGRRARGTHRRRALPDHAPADNPFPSTPSPSTPLGGTGGPPVTCPGGAPTPGPGRSSSVR